MRIDSPPGIRTTGGTEGFKWTVATDRAGHRPYRADLEYLHGLFTTAESRQVYLERVRDYLRAAEDGRLEYGKGRDVSGPMAAGPDVLEIRLPDWQFARGRMHVRLYYSEPVDRPLSLVLLRLRAKWPRDVGLVDQTATIRAASMLLREFRDTGYPGC